jgi:hypothetical protein
MHFDNCLSLDPSSNAHTTKEGVGSANHTKACPKRGQKGREKIQQSLQKLGFGLYITMLQSNFPFLL